MAAINRRLLLKRIILLMIIRRRQRRRANNKKKKRFWVRRLYQERRAYSAEGPRPCPPRTSLFSPSINSFGAACSASWDSWGHWEDWEVTGRLRRMEFSVLMSKRWGMASFLVSLAAILCVRAQFSLVDFMPRTSDAQKSRIKSNSFATGKSSLREKHNFDCACPREFILDVCRVARHLSPSGKRA